MPPKHFNTNHKSRSRGGPHAAAARQPTGTNSDASRPSSKPKRPAAAKIKAGTSMRKSATQLRSEIRGLERLLNKKRDTLNAQARSDMERKLAALKFQLDRTQTLQRDAAKVEKFEAMYRAVKFVERVKATRTVRKLQRKLETAGEDEDLQTKLDDAMLDVCYVMHFPPATKYYALYKTPEDKEAEMARDEIRDQIRSLVESGAIDREATVARCLGLDEDGPREKKKTKRKGMTEEEVRHQALGNMLRGVKVEKKKGAAGVDETIESEAKPINDDFFMADDASDDDESDSEEEEKAVRPAARGKKAAAAASSASSSDASSSDESDSDSDDDMSE
ncbi:18S rRNA maturation protein [Allomyces javanicus]|nr:18S rRNA maturation protein [Allomyces javanicus]